jgi:hypothetical protein
MTWRHDFALPRVNAEHASERPLTVSDADRKAEMAELLALGYPDEGPTLGRSTRRSGMGG